MKLLGRRNQNPIVLVNFMWGQYLEGYELEDAVLAFSAFLEQTPGLGATTADDTENKVPPRHAPQ